MQSFLKYWLNESTLKETTIEEDSKNKWTFVSSYEDIDHKNISDKYLKRLLKFLFKHFEEYSGTKLKSINVDLTAGGTKGGISGYRAVLNISTGISKRADSLVKRKEIVDTFFEKAFVDNQPLFYTKSLDGKEFSDFIWYGDRSEIEGSKVLQKDAGMKYSKPNKLDFTSGKAYRRFISYYSIETKDIADFLKLKDGKTKTIDEDEIAVAAKANGIETKCVVSITLHDADVKSNLESNVETTSELMEEIIPYKKVRLFKDKRLYYRVTAEQKDSLLATIENKIKNSKVLSQTDKDVYSAFFEGILSSSEPNNDFKISKLKDKLEAAYGQDIMSQSADKYYRLNISEVLIPFILIGGYSKIEGRSILTDEDGKDITSGLKIKSIEIPKSNINVLTDYSVTFINAEVNGEKKTFAISAKLGDDHNMPSLFTLLRDNWKIGRKAVVNELIKDNDSGFKIALDVAKDANIKGRESEGWKKYIVEFAQKWLPDSENVAKYVKAFSYEDLKIGNSQRQPWKNIKDKLNQAKWIQKSKPKEAKEIKKTIEEIESSISKYLKQKKDSSATAKSDRILNAYPYSIPVVSDYVCAGNINEDKDFLLSIYKLVFEYYGENTEFQQIQLNKDWSLKYVRKQKEVNEEKIADLISIESKASVDKNAEKIDLSAMKVSQPLMVVLK